MLPLTKRQRQIFDYLSEHIQQHNYAPSLEEIGHRFNLSSLATIHKHLTNLQEKGYIRRAWNRSRSIELVATHSGERAVKLPLLASIEADLPIEAMVTPETISVPETLVSNHHNNYALRVNGNSIIDEQIKDGDLVIIEDRKSVNDGETVLVLLSGIKTTLKKIYRENGRIRLQSGDPSIKPIIVEQSEVKIHGVVVAVMRKY